MKTLAQIVTILAAFAGILTLSVVSGRRQQRQLLDDFTVAGREQVRTSAAALSSRLDAFDQDTSLLIDLVDKSMSGREVELATERRVWVSAFQALSTVVPNYRTIGLFRPDGSVEVMGVDPTENPSTASTLIERSRDLARVVAATGKRMLAKDAVHYGHRWFLFYGAPIRGGAIVIASDVALFLATVVSTYPSLSRLFVADPSGVVWSGCETPDGCHMTPPEAVPRPVRAPPTGVSQIDAAAAEAMQLGPAPAVRITERVDRPTGTWTLTLAASSQSIVDRERALFARLVFTALGVAVAVAGVGLVILRQQRRAATLEGRLHYAQELASALVRAEKLITVGVLSAGIAHEIGSPLAVIRGRAEQVRRRRRRAKVRDWG